jgi:transcriptional regulator with XRE-family HTH domain
MFGIGRRLKVLRFESGLSREQIALKLNISASAYGHYESERNFPSIEILVKLSELFDCSIDYLLGRTKIRKPSKVENFEDLPQEAVIEINNYINYIKNKYSKK